MPPRAIRVSRSLSGFVYRVSLIHYTDGDRCFCGVIIIIIIIIIKFIEPKAKSDANINQKGDM